jgi:hypothetical protein
MSDPMTKDHFLEVEAMKEDLCEYLIKETVRPLVIYWVIKVGD